MIFKAAKTTQWGKDSLSTNGAEKIGYTHGKKVRGNPNITSNTETNSKWMKDLNVRHNM